MAGISNALWRALVATGLGFVCSCSHGWQGPRAPVEAVPTGQRSVAAKGGAPSHAQWTFKGSAFFSGAPVAVGRFLAIGDRKGRVQFIDPNTGKSKADLKGKGGLCRGLAWDAERLYVVSEHAGRALQCFELTDGKLAWYRKFSQPPEEPIRSGAELWLPWRDSIYALDPRTGEVIRVVVAGTDLWGTPVPWGAGWAVLGRSGTLVSLAGDGSRRWSIDLASHCVERPVACGESLWVSTAAGTLFCVSGGGDVIFEEYLDSTALFSASVGTDDICVGASSGNVWMLNRLDGSVRWQRALDAPLAGAPLVHDGWVAAALRDGHLELLEAGTGSTLHSIDYESILSFAPTWAFGRLYVVDSERKLHALGTGP